MFEPIVYCNCGNTKEYGVWQFQPAITKEAIKKIVSKKSAICPVCRCIDAMKRAKIALESV